MGPLSMQYCLQPDMPNLPWIFYHFIWDIEGKFTPHYTAYKYHNAGKTFANFFSQTKNKKAHHYVVSEGNYSTNLHCKSETNTSDQQQVHSSIELKWAPSSGG